MDARHHRRRCRGRVDRVGRGDVRPSAVVRRRDGRRRGTRTRAWNRRDATQMASEPQTRTAVSIETGGLTIMKPNAAISTGISVAGAVVIATGLLTITLGVIGLVNGTPFVEY